MKSILTVGYVILQGNRGVRRIRGEERVKLLEGGKAGVSEGAQGDDLCIVIWILTEKYSKGMCKAWVSEGAQGGIHSSLSVSRNPPPDFPALSTGH